MTSVCMAKVFYLEQHLRHRQFSAEKRDPGCTNKLPGQVGRTLIKHRSLPTCEAET
jgi:hypothetical protein